MTPATRLAPEATDRVDRRSLGGRATSWLTARPRRELGAAWLFLAMVTATLHGSALRGGWRADDGEHLRFAVTHAPWEYFLVPEVIRAHHGATLTPWNILFYDLNLRLFGFAPKGHYAHLLLLIAAGASLLYAVLRQSLEPQAALAGATAFLLSGPTVAIAQHLMVGHYATALMFSLGAVYGYIRYTRGGHASWLVAGSTAYLLATLCKEVAVPVVLLLPFLSATSRERRLRALAPYLGVALGYVLWRRVALGVFVGGYSPTGEGFDPVDCMRQLAALPGLLFGGGAAGFVGVVTLLALLLSAGRTGRFHVAVAVAVAVVVVLPLIPLTIKPGLNRPDRYLYFSGVALAAGIAFAWPRLRDPRWRVIPALGLLVLLGLGQQRERESLREGLRRIDAISGYALHADTRAEGLFVADDDGYLLGVLPSLRKARDRFEGRPPSPPLAVLTNTPAALQIVLGDAWSGRRWLQYVDGVMRPMSPLELSAAVTTLREGLRRGHEKALRVEFRHDSGLLRWEFGPWDGSYLVGWDGGGSFLTRKGAFPWPEKKPLELYVCFVGDGWISCSPRLRFDAAKGPLRWSGPGVAPRDTDASSRADQVR